MLTPVELAKLKAQALQQEAYNYFHLGAKRDPQELVSKSIAAISAWHAMLEISDDRSVDAMRNVYEEIQKLAAIAKNVWQVEVMRLLRMQPLADTDTLNAALSQFFVLHAGYVLAEYKLNNTSIIIQANDVFKTVLMQLGDTRQLSPREVADLLQGYIVESEETAAVMDTSRDPFEEYVKHVKLDFACFRLMCLEQNLQELKEKNDANPNSRAAKVNYKTALEEIIQLSTQVLNMAVELPGHELVDSEHLIDLKTRSAEELQQFAGDALLFGQGIEAGRRGLPRRSLSGPDPSLEPLTPNNGLHHRRNRSS